MRPVGLRTEKGCAGVVQYLEYKIRCCVVLYYWQMLRLTSSIIFYKIYDNAMWPMQNIAICSVSVGCTATCGSLERINEWMKKTENYRPDFSLERVPPHRQICNCLKIINEGRNWSRIRDGCLTPRQTCWLNIGRNITWLHLVYLSVISCCPCVTTTHSHSHCHIVIITAIVT
jgi:hypothetical protein